MKLEQTENGQFLIYQDVGYRRRYFCFFVDSDKSSWSLFASQARYYASEELAIEQMAEINERRRARLKK